MEALGAYGRLRRHADALGSIAASFSAEAERVAAAYETALRLGGDAAWARFVEAAAELALHAHSVDGIVHLSERERAAHDYFQQIGRENGDLLAGRTVAFA